MSNERRTTAISDWRIASDVEMNSASQESADYEIGLIVVLVHGLDLPRTPERNQIHMFGPVGRVLIVAGRIPDSLSETLFSPSRELLLSTYITLHTFSTFGIIRKAYNDFDTST